MTFSPAISIETMRIHTEGPEGLHVVSIQNSFIPAKWILTRKVQYFPERLENLAALKVYGMHVSGLHQFQSNIDDLTQKVQYPLGRLVRPADRRD